ncbi:MAG: hypothetical protein NW216_04585 [Hyphomicrobium sp.]|nr:hypothetical protein [Hyphomicrobium sp.]
MISIQSAMLVALGFAAAGLLACLLAPVYGARAARLAVSALKRSMPLTAAEIAADKDRLRAEYAIKIHKLEQKLEEGSLSAARQLVEINRRDASISALEGELVNLKTSIEEHENARRVLEQTIAERLPKVEARLSEAKKLLFERDREIAALTQSAQRQSQALEEATQINTQQRDEIHRLSATLTTRAARNREPANDQRFEAEIALRSELEALRAKTRDQAQLISRLQGVYRQAGASTAATPGLFGAPLPAIDPAAQDSEIARLRESLADAELALQSAKGVVAVDRAGQEKLETDIRSLKSELQDRQAEVARLKASLKAYEDSAASDRAVAESKITLKARLSALEAQSTEQQQTIQSLRAEIAAANEKLARQAAHYMDEMRRLGAGTRPTAAPGARDVTAPPRGRASLVDRISAPRVAVREVETDTRRAGAEAAVEVIRKSEIAAVPANEMSAMSGADEAKAVESRPASRRPGLLERITGIEKPAGQA